MKNPILLLSLFGTVLLLLGFSGTTSQGSQRRTSESLFGSSAANGLYRATGVRAEFVDLSGNWPHTDTQVHIVNTSATTQLTLREVHVLGPNGVKSVIAIYWGLVNKIVPPLGQVDLHIDRGIPGVVPQTSPSGSGVRNIVVVWAGPTDALNLSATIRRSRHNGTHEDMSRVIAEGYDVKF
jgi:hypothetical protein